MRKEKSFVMIDINEARKGNVVVPELNSLGKLNKIFDELIKHNADFDGAAIPAEELHKGLIVDTFENATLAVTDSIYRVYLLFQKAISSAIAMASGSNRISRRQACDLAVPVFQRYLYDRLENCHDGEDLQITVDIIEHLAYYQCDYADKSSIAYLPKSDFSLLQQQITVIRTSNVKTDDFIKQYKDVMIQPVFDLIQLFWKVELTPPTFKNDVESFMKNLWQILSDCVAHNYNFTAFADFKAQYERLQSEFAPYGGIRCVSGQMDMLEAYVNSLT